MLKVTATIGNHIGWNHVHLNVWPILVFCFWIILNILGANKRQTIDASRCQRTLNLGFHNYVNISSISELTLPNTQARTYLCPL